MSDNYCNNCGKQGHLFHQCKMPITSIGIIVFRYNTERNIEYLMIRRKDTLGFVDFMRGKYSVYNKGYIINMIKQMTCEEKECLQNYDFDQLWRRIWGSKEISNQYKIEEIASREKFNSLKTGILNKNDFYGLNDLIQDCSVYDQWTEPEWGFPKGRRNYQEKDYDCALREFREETGLNTRNMVLVDNLLPYEELFTGSNYKSYKHKYFVSYLPYEDTLNTKNFEPSEVSSMKWKSYDKCMETIRPYNLEKKRVITNIHNTLTNCKIFY
jgi:ADP-ribose pyrophosphatase YjhB (NUDIX family)